MVLLGFAEIRQEKPWGSTRRAISRLRLTSTGTAKSAANAIINLVYGMTENNPLVADMSYALYRKCAGQVALRWEIKPDRRRIPDTTPWTKPPYFGRTIALWGLYSAFILS